MSFYWWTFMIGEYDSFDLDSQDILDFEQYNTPSLLSQSLSLFSLYTFCSLSVSLLFTATSFVEPAVIELLLYLNVNLAYGLIHL